jgi:leucyl-tRNA synthetase
MIQGSSRFVYRIEIRGSEQVESRIRQSPLFVSLGIKDQDPQQLLSIIKEPLKKILGEEQIGTEDIGVSAIHVDVNLVDGLELDVAAFKSWRPEYANAEFILENGKYICGSETEKMSKSKFNTVDPTGLVEKYGADTFRMYEMFLGPIEQSKPWDTKGIEGVHRFLRKLWRLFYEESKGKLWTSDPATPAELKVLHKTIKKVDEDTEKYSFNTAVSAMMIAVNELSELKCHKKEVLEKILIILTPYAPHIAEELWHQLGNDTSILDATYPVADQQWLVESEKQYPVAINGKTRTELNISLDATQQQVEALVLADGTVIKWLGGKSPKKIIYVKNKMINIVT